MSDDDWLHGIGLALQYAPRSSGWEVTFVVPNSSAESASLKLGDVVLSVDDERIGADFDPLKTFLGRKGSIVKLQLAPGNVSVQVVRAGPPLDRQGVRQDGAFGMSFASNSSRLVYVDPQGAAGRGGLMVGDVVTAVDGRRVPSDQNPELQPRGPCNQKVLFEINRNGTICSLAIARRPRDSGWTGTVGVGMSSSMDARASNHNGSSNGTAAIQGTQSARSLATRPPHDSAVQSSSASKKKPSSSHDGGVAGSGSSGKTGRSSSKSKTLRPADELGRSIDSSSPVKRQHSSARSVQSVGRIREEGGNDAEMVARVAALQRQVVEMRRQQELVMAAMGETKNCLKKMNDGIHQAVDGITYELTILFKHVGLPRPDNPHMNDNDGDQGAEAAQIES